MCIISQPTQRPKAYRVMGWTWDRNSDILPTLSLMLQRWKVRNLTHILATVQIKELQFRHKATSSEIYKVYSERQWLPYLLRRFDTGRSPTLRNEQSKIVATENQAVKIDRMVHNSPRISQSCWNAVATFGVVRPNHLRETLSRWGCPAITQPQIVMWVRYGCAEAAQCSTYREVHGGEQPPNFQSLCHCNWAADRFR